MKENINLSNNAIIDGDDIILSNFFNFIKKNIKSIIKIIFYFNIIFTFYYFLKTPEYSSKLSFYTNYESSDETSLLSSFTGSLESSNLNFSVEDFIFSNKLLTELVNSNYDIDDKSISLKELWAGGYSDFTLNPIIILLRFNQNLKFTQGITESDIKTFIAIEELKEKLSIEFNEQTNLFSVFVSIKNYPSLGQQINEKIFEEIVIFSSSIVSAKSSEQVSFVSNQLTEMKNKLTDSENALISFIEKNKSLQSAKLQIEKKRLETDINLYSQLFISLSDQLEKAKIEENNTTTPIFLLDEPIIPFEKNEVSLFMGYILSSIFGFFISILFLIFTRRKELIK